jgi:transglutaminase-like putative cysteine protease
MREFLASGKFVDSGASNVVAYGNSIASGETNPTRIARCLYYAVRDDVLYDPYIDYWDDNSYRASSCLAAGKGFCVSKAALLAATARVRGIPSRVGFADVRNHLATPKLLEVIGSDVFIYHGYTELYLNGKWVKVTPTFNSSLCERLRVPPLEFDGETDALMHSYNLDNQKYMEYVRMRGVHDDVPVSELQVAFRETYPNLCKEAEKNDGVFSQE